jgi:hypothetical protein
MANEAVVDMIHIIMKGVAGIEERNRIKETLVKVSSFHGDKADQGALY